MKTAIALLIGSSVGLSVAQSADWNGSYSASGQCFCVGELPASTRMSIVPTPIGGQTVAQVCQRLGEGPGLVRENGLFNHPVYTDAQCGNGPGLATSRDDKGGCSGSLEAGSDGTDSCIHPGPRWDIQGALDRERAPAYVNTGIQVASAVPVYVSSSAGFIGKTVTTVRERPVSVQQVSRITAPPESSQWVIIEGNRYIRSREGIPAAGGEPGQRIILDGFVYLRDDGSLNPDDLFYETSEDVSADSGPDLSSQSRVAAEPVVRKDDEKLAEARRLKERQAAARQLRDDARATARQIEAQRRRLRQEQQMALMTRQKLDLQELQRSKQRLEAESASRAQAALQAHAEAQSIEPASAGLAESPKQSISGSAYPLSEGKSVAEPPVAAAAPASELDTREEAVREAGSQVLVPADADEVSVSTQGSEPVHASVSSALRLPAAVRASSRNFRYLEALPVSYDVGGDGVMLEGSTSSHSRLQYFGRLGVTRRYNEVMAGAGYYLTPESASRLTFVLLAGIEYGNFELVDGQSPEISVDYDDSGVYLGASSRMVVSNRFELKAGIGYSSIFEGDAMFFGGGYLHLTRKLDLVTRFELGDNDLLGIGVRYYY
ncbi:hypothetical protein ACUNV4_06385 [Granulosicoccus sp. 3-233]